ncbi:hypothetical protein N1027_18105 [Herbiconiux sp. CPCC 205763]|uniref:Nitroreductase family deazaflavin-dependent oxidoreductase n=1 Tax=Herbiconiux aconitum TaxID=2970913 RepID=A0ABT2GV54_9MICO|nr:hypothetical protein [Herbiconiux aconitum]MCS5720048.1 hypothetical protein [Herbiconiux aconitum]
MRHADAGGYWGMSERMRRGFLWVLKNTLNRLTLRLARAGVGPFSLLRHTGRKSGKTFEVPLILAETSDGDLVAELTYGTGVNWYRNLLAGGDAVVVRGRREWRIVGVKHLDADEGLRAFGNPAAVILKLLGKREFRVLGSPPCAEPRGNRRDQLRVSSPVGIGARFVGARRRRQRLESRPGAAAQASAAAGKAYGASTSGNWRTGADEMVAVWLPTERRFPSKASCVGSPVVAHDTR